VVLRTARLLPGRAAGVHLAFTPDSLPELAGVLVSHVHYDHFDLAAFSAYTRS